jgi:AcrR family transcriptional regulator
MPGTKKAEDPSMIMTAAMELFTKKGFSKVTLADIAKASGVPVGEVRASYPTKEELLIAAFRPGQKKMEERFRTIMEGDLDAHIGLMFDGIMEGLMPYGPEVHLNLLYQATSDKILTEIIRRTSRNVNFAIKAYLAQMVAMAIMEVVDEVERVNEEMVASFVQHVDTVLEGKKVPAIRKAWVAHIRRMLQPSEKTTIAPSH